MAYIQHIFNMFSTHFNTFQHIFNIFYANIIPEKNENMLKHRIDIFWSAQMLHIFSTYFRHISTNIVHIFDIFSFFENMSKICRNTVSTYFRNAIYVEDLLWYLKPPPRLSIGPDTARSQLSAGHPASNGSAWFPLPGSCSAWRPAPP